MSVSLEMVLSVLARTISADHPTCEPQSDWEFVGAWMHFHTAAAAIQHHDAIGCATLFHRADCNPFGSTAVALGDVKPKFYHSGSMNMDPVGAISII